MPITTIDQALATLDEIILEAQEQKSRHGYFAALYHHVGVQFKTTIEERSFKLYQMMEQLDIAFFNRYLDAVDKFERGLKPTQSWQVAFDAGETPEPIILQHLMLGMNAHINLDLGIAVATACPPDQLAALEPDFIQMNVLLENLMNDIMHDLTQVWPHLALLNQLGGAGEVFALHVGMETARQKAWAFAVQLANASPSQRNKLIAQADAEVAALGHLIWKPPLAVRLLLPFIREGETHSVDKVINILLHRVKRERPANQPRKKVVVLGGGAGALTAAFALTDPANIAADEFDVSVYQMGWRLGGKGASGRNAANGYRIEEHGLHIWFGFYENAFRVMQMAYGELGRAPDAPLASWRDAFKPHSYIAVKEKVEGQWLNWATSFPTNDAVPGDGQAMLPMWDYVVMGLKMMHEMFADAPEARADPNSPQVVQHGLLSMLGRIFDELRDETLSLGGQLLLAAWRVAEWLNTEPEAVARELMKSKNPILEWLGEQAAPLFDKIESAVNSGSQYLLLRLLNDFITWYWERVKEKIETDAPTRHRWVNMNLFYGNIRGALESGVLSKGFDVINHLDYREWLGKFVIDDGGLTVGSPIVASVYDAVFAYQDGDSRMGPNDLYPPKANFEAGTALRAGMRQFLTYKGAIMWKMQAGMGDVVFVPLYKVMRRRGVKFHFFYRVKRIVPSADNKKIERIILSRQVQLVRDEYDPLITVNGLRSWPNEPLYDQIVDGEKLRGQKIDFEGYTNNIELDEVILEAGKDFDAVVLGISLGALPYVCGDLIRASDKWRNMVNHVKTARTQAFQLWLKPTAFELGWLPMSKPVLSSLDITPFNTWADMSHLTKHESWSHNPYPLNVSYFCGPMRDDPAITPSPDGPVQDSAQLDQQKGNDTAKQNALDFLQNDMPLLLPTSMHADKDGKQVFDWKMLVDLHPEEHADDPFASQYWRANVSPSERYVLSVAGSSKYRLPAHSKKEFTNLYLAGDWTDNAMNVGCVEAAVMSGLLCSLALSGYPERHDIVGLDFTLANFLR